MGTRSYFGPRTSYLPRESPHFLYLRALGVSQVPRFQEVVRGLGGHRALTGGARGAGQAEERGGAPRRARKRGLELGDGRGRIAGAEQNLRVQLACRLDRVRTRDRLRPLRLELGAPRERRQRAAPIVARKLD